MCLILFLLLFCSLFGTHHDPSVYHPGDFPRESLDWGLHQLDATNDSDKSIFGGLFGVAILLGDHLLHHLFPAIDISKARQLYPVLYETCLEFGVRPPNYSRMDEGLFNLFKQMVRTEPTTYEQREKAKP